MTRTAGERRARSAAWVTAVVCLSALPRPGTAQDPRLGFGGWEWDHRPNETHAVVAVFDGPSGRLQDVYTEVVGSPCEGEPTPDSVFVRRAAAFLKGVGWEHLFPRQNRVQHYGDDLVHIEFWALDPGADVIFSPAGGMLFAATSMWSGTGEQLWPTDPLPSWAWSLESEVAPEPNRVTSVLGEVPDSIVTAFRRLSVIHDLSSEPYSLAAFFYARDPQIDFQGTNWIVMGIRSPQCR